MRFFLSQTRKSFAPSLSLVILPTVLAGFSTSTLALDSNSRQLNSATIAKMSNGEGYVTDLSPRASKLIQDSIDLFSAKPSHEIFERSWAGPCGEEGGKTAGEIIYFTRVSRFYRDSGC